MCMHCPTCSDKHPPKDYSCVVPFVFKTGAYYRVWMPDVIHIFLLLICELHAYMQVYST